MKSQNKKVIMGNAFDSPITSSYKGWLVGHFVKDNSELYTSKEVEVKWGVHTKNERKEANGVNILATTLTILISGSFIMEFPALNKKITLNKIGDYLIFPPGVSHYWVAEADSIVLTIRWPSIENDQVLI